MKIPSRMELNIPSLINAAFTFDSYGKLERSSNNLIYLDIDDAYIHHLFPLLQDESIQKPDYFGVGSVGAHVTVVYPEEHTVFMEKYLGKEYHFKVKKLVVAEINLKKYYVLLVDSPMLLQVRNNHGLPDQLNFKDYLIDFHITIGVSY